MTRRKPLPSARGYGVDRDLALLHLRSDRSFSAIAVPSGAGIYPAIYPCRQPVVNGFRQRLMELTYYAQRHNVLYLPDRWRVAELYSAEAASATALPRADE